MQYVSDLEYYNNGTQFGLSLAIVVKLGDKVLVAEACNMFDKDPFSSPPLTKEPPSSTLNGRHTAMLGGDDDRRHVPGAAIGGQGAET